MLDDARRDTKFGHHNVRLQSLCCGMIIDEKRPNGLDVLAAMGLRLLRFLTGWARNNMSAIEAEADSATAWKCPAQSGNYGTKYCTSGVQCSS
jgi:hypothetical protein